MRVLQYTRTQVIAASVTTAALLVLVFLQPIRNTYEDVAFALDPSASRASMYGERHFSSGNGAGYDVDRAEYFYRKAATLDPQYPFVYHQLARIEFLRGNFYKAMSRINKQVELHGGSAPNSYYVRGLIEGYMGRYDDAVRDYAYYLSLVSPNWAGLNDYAWVLLKAERFEDALAATEKGLSLFPDNAWLLNSSAIALYETADFSRALERAKAAVAASARVTEQQWLIAYPGNDPRVAAEGIATLRRSAEDNMHMIEVALAP